MNSSTCEQLPLDKQPTTRMAARPADTNAAGDIFGGWIMSQVDIAGSIAAYRRARGRVVTVAVNEFQFHKPVFVGDLISCYADVIKVGRTSITVYVEVYAERHRPGGEDEVIKVTEATLTFVAVSEERQPRLVPDQ
ncbi:MAG TPA: acyl-CoA thioesterase [Chromatiales bacterium]|nr:acyl-CoA thioesterase [Chromatiales bacterium]